MNLFQCIAFCLLAALAPVAYADSGVNISQAWARVTAPGQAVAAAYMTLQSPADSTLVKIESSAAGSVEIHSMTMKNGVMKMRMLDTLALTAGKPAKLEPGGFHLMLFDLKKPLRIGETVQFTLHFKDGAGKTSAVTVSAPIRSS